MTTPTPAQVEAVAKAIDAKTLLALKRAIGETTGPLVHMLVPSGQLEILIDAYMERAALLVINDQMEKQGAEIAPYWAHYMMATVLRKWDCSRGIDTCRGSSLCITEYCHSCYAKVWWNSQQMHKTQKYRCGMPKKTKQARAAILALGIDIPSTGAPA